MEFNKIKKQIQNLTSQENEIQNYENKLFRAQQYDGDDRVIPIQEAVEELNIQKDKYQLFSKIPRLDEIVGGFREGQLVVVSAPTGQGKTSMMQTFTENFDEKCLWFTYEVGLEEFIEKFSEIPLFYLPRQLKQNSLVWLENKIIEAKAKFGCKVIFIDHLHYLLEMQKMAEAKSISLLVGMMMRELKKMAIHHEIIIFLVSHMRKILYDRLPEIEDLRDCLPANQLIYVNGQRKRVDKIKKGDIVVSYKSIKKLQLDKIADIWQTGKKKIFKLTTKTGRQIECSSGHKFYATTFKKAKKFGASQGCGIAGWIKLKDLQIGQKIAVVKNYPDTKREDINSEQAKLLGWIIGDGYITKNYYSEITTATKKEAEFIKRIAGVGFNLDCKITSYKDKKAYRVYLTGNNKKNKLAHFLKKNKFNPIKEKKYVPEFMFRQSKKIIGEFLSGLFQADGSINLGGKNKSEAILVLHTISEQLAKDVQSLFTRLGIISFRRKQKMESSGFKSSMGYIWQVNLYGRNIIQFGKMSGFVLDKKRRFDKLLKNWKPKEKERNQDLFFDRIKSIEYIGEKETYDISVKGHHKSLRNNSFCVNDFITHNSSFIGQESDLVFFIKRVKEGEEYTNKAVLKVAKNRRTGKLGNVRLIYNNHHFEEYTDAYDEEYAKIG